MSILSSEAFDGLESKTEFDSFLQKEIKEVHSCEHKKIVKQLLEKWGIWEEKYNEQDFDAIHICNFAKDLIISASNQLKKYGTSVETIQSLFWKRISREDFNRRE